MSLFTGAIATAAILGSTSATTIYGAKKAGHAAKLESESAAAALEYTKQKDAQERADAMAAQKASYEQWAAKERRMSPYRAAGQGASQTIASMLGLPAVEIPDPAPPPDFLTAPPLSARAGSGSSAAPGSANVGTLGDLTGSGGTVNMVAPNGTIKAVPREQVEHFKKLGAQVVN